MEDAAAVGGDGSVPAQAPLTGVHSSARTKRRQQKQLAAQEVGGGSSAQLGSVPPPIGMSTPLHPLLHNNTGSSTATNPPPSVHVVPLPFVLPDASSTDGDLGGGNPTNE